MNSGERVMGGTGHVSQEASASSGIAGKVRLYEVAKDLGLQNKDLVMKVRALGIEVKNHMSNLDVEDVLRIKRAIEKERQANLVEERLSSTVIRRRSRGEMGGRPDVSSRATDRSLATPATPPRSDEKAVESTLDSRRAAEEAFARLQAKKTGGTGAFATSATQPAPSPSSVSTPTRSTASSVPPLSSSPSTSISTPSSPPPSSKEPTTIATTPAPSSLPPPSLVGSLLQEPEVEAATSKAVSETPERVGEKTKGEPPTPPVVSSSPPLRPQQEGTSTVVAGGGQVATTPTVEPPKKPEPVKYGPTGRVIELPKPRYEITQADNRDRFAPRDARGPQTQRREAPGQRDRFGRPQQGKKRAQVGKKQQHTQITTPAAHKRVIKMEETIAVGEIAKQMGVKATDVLKKLWSMGMTGITLNNAIDLDTATLLATDFGFDVESIAFQEADVFASAEDKPEDLVLRAPVVTIMGHVDHGKTSLLDAIRDANVAAGEAGGITQHIGAYKITTAEGQEVVFLDTPGHEAFTAMRARGAQATDLVVLVVAADDGVMPTTVEALNHAKAAEVSIIVAVNKIDKPGAQPDRIRQQLSDHGLIPEQWGGETIYVDVSARTKQGLDQLLSMISLQAEILELKANPNKSARGTIVEAKLDRNRGPMATVLVQDGTLKLGDTVVAGEFIGKVRAMLDDNGRSLSEVGPSTPVELLGLSGVPEAGEALNAVSDEKQAKELVEHRREQRRKKELAGTSRVTLENILEKIKEGAVKELKVVLKADVQGSSEALKAALVGLSTEQVKVDVISAGVGGITESDVNLAKAGNAIIVGFHVRPAGKAQQLAEQEGVDVKLYDIIYEALDDVKKAMAGLLAPVKREKPLGKAEVRQTFSIPKVGVIAGSFVLEGTIKRNALVRLVRDSVQIYQGKLISLRRFKDDAREVEKGYECGIGLENYNDIKVGDVVEAYEIEEIAATLS
jgi:translation initiation factor IF-2